MHERASQHLLDMINASEHILAFTDGKDLPAYTMDLLLRSAVERQFLIVGEALLRLKRDDPTTLQLVPDHREIIGFRNVLAHGYDAIADERVWATIQLKLRPFVARVRWMLAAT